MCIMPRWTRDENRGFFLDALLFSRFFSPGFGDLGVEVMHVRYGWYMYRKCFFGGECIYIRYVNYLMESDGERTRSFKLFSPTQR